MSPGPVPPISTASSTPSSTVTRSAFVSVMLSPAPCLYRRLVIGAPWSRTEGCQAQVTAPASSQIRLLGSALMSEPKRRARLLLWLRIVLSLGLLVVLVVKSPEK